MNFIERIKKDMYSAMKSGEKEKSATLRTLLAKLKDKQINSGKELDENEGLSVIKMLVKQRKESSEMYKKASRMDLADQENLELTILEYYLPKMMSENETRILVKGIIDKTGSKDIGDLGKLMPLIMKQGSGLIDGKLANSILRELLS
ncbi:MAG: GatB/YqeY domain-containing protein [Fidelibacterota bacterium]|jgi:uncharacterized protein YqeY|tara:strand:- start:7 stop:450 length:444 start_codon:yes stop_codon:yes gene_type:complete